MPYDRTPNLPAPACLNPNQLSLAKLAFLHPHILAVDIHAGMHVVEQIPARMVGVLVNYKVISAVPAPVRAERPIPGGHLKIETSGKPESVKARVKPDDVVAIAWPKFRKVAVRKRMIQMESRIIRRIVSVKFIAAHVRRIIGLSTGQMLHFAPSACVRPCSGSGRNFSPVRTGRVGRMCRRCGMCRRAATLRRARQHKKESHAQEKSRSKNQSQTCFHVPLLCVSSLMQGRTLLLVFNIGARDALLYLPAPDRSPHRYSPRAGCAKARGGASLRLARGLAARMVPQWD